MFYCGSETKTTDHFFLPCPSFAINRKKLFNDLLKIDPSLKNLKDELLLLHIILYGSDKYKSTVKKEILLHRISFIKNTKASKDRYMTTNLLLLFFIINIYVFSRKF